ncbi:hypothetical protein [Nitrosospira multiformis]|uniref:Uncharacterized protein n=1 Tax=Nitrosospira multiformis TaxID=1231 RepID=A0A1I7HIQ3_9PROT|nr:hypothetical protein [Nitrosospira multiformis]SFU60472.1 hypothetical protein SAMN05216417_109102 [Nitrosospira multiformis]
MPITGFTWARFKGGDIHILRNNQPSLPLEDALIVVEEITTLTDPDGNHKLEFKSLKNINAGVDPPPEFGRAIFNPSWVAQATRTSPSSISFNGITLDERTGEITATASNDPHLITSFFMEVVLEPSSGHTLSLPPNATPPIIVVHVHNSITSAWVTPSSLTVRPDILKGISQLELKLVSTKPIEKITWGSDDTFQHSMGKFLLNGFDPFEGVTNFSQGAAFLFPSSVLFDNRRLFPVNEVFVDPIHLEVKYASQANPVRMTIPTHLIHLIQTGQTFDDGAGNTVFEVSNVEKKAQYKASAYATFDDGTIGDLTNQHGLTWARGAGVDATDIKFDSDGAFEVATSAVTKTLPIMMQLPVRLTGTGVTGATGNVIVRDSWLNATPIAERLAGSPIQLPAAEIPNVLFVAEGFTNRGEFRHAALSVYDKLRNESKTTPWNHLFRNRMNAWMLFEESRESSASYLYESIALENVRVEDGTSRNVALPLWEMIDFGASRLNDSIGLNVSALVSRVGLPLPADAQATRAAKTNEWRQLVDTNFGTGNLSFSDDEFNFWRRLSQRILVEERDTAWGLRCGEKPKPYPTVQSNFIALNDEARLQRSNLDLFLSRVRADSVTGDLVGERFWGRDRQGKFGKDYGLVVFLVGGSRSIGARFSETRFPQGLVNTGIGAGMVDARVALSFLGPQFTGTFPFFVWTRTTGAPSFQMDPFPVPPQVSVTAFATIAHELGHSFNLEDEYARIGRLRMPEAEQDRVRSVFNLQGHNDLLTAGQLSGEGIKWRWPRIKKAGVLESAPTVGSQISVILRAGDVGQFVVNETVRFRQRNLRTPLADLSSPDLKILSKDESNRTVVLEPLITTPVNWGAFGPNSLLYAPVKAPTENRNNPMNDVYAEVLSPLLRHQINETHSPQTREPCQEDDKDQQDPVNLPANLNRPQEHRRIVGLFSGGKGFSCDVYHASGECLMRKETALISQAVGGVITSTDRHTYQFCHVCQYILVDQIDPRQHGEIDKKYDENYPSLDKPTSVLKTVLIIAGVLVLLGLGYLIAKKSD